MSRFALLLIALLTLLLGAVTAQAQDTITVPGSGDDSSGGRPTGTGSDTVIPSSRGNNSDAEGAAAIITPIGEAYAAWQPFEGGVMMWWSDTEQIWVFTNEDGAVQVFEDPYDDQDDPVAAAPRGFYTPERGFGQIWVALGGENSKLGWAMAPEIGFDSAARSMKDQEVIVQGPGATVYAVSIRPNSGEGTWRVINIG